MKYTEELIGRLLEASMFLSVNFRNNDIVQLLNDAAEELRRLLPYWWCWVDVGTEAPPVGVEVLVCTKSKNGKQNVDKGYFDGERYIHRGCAEVTHWCELPELPKEGEQNA